MKKYSLEAICFFVLYALAFSSTAQTISNVVELENAIKRRYVPLTEFSLKRDITLDLSQYSEYGFSPKLIDPISKVTLNSGNVGNIKVCINAKVTVFTQTKFIKEMGLLGYTMSNLNCDGAYLAQVTLDKEIGFYKNLDVFAVISPSTLPAELVLQGASLKKLNPTFTVANSTKNMEVAVSSASTYTSTCNNPSQATPADILSALTQVCSQLSVIDQNNLPLTYGVQFELAPKTDNVWKYAYTGCSALRGTDVCTISTSWLDSAVRPRNYNIQFEWNRSIYVTGSGVSYLGPSIPVYSNMVFRLVR